ncbi:PepSY domain-containing protein [Thiohalorhabdus methylotrophus]|uniref:PepSY domain-containing protein n=1 Tax=Thiohalorhabdus methylotrophus TaxID=3242694 RepID=A0ABV4TYY7_9GAMM
MRKSTVLLSVLLSATFCISTTAWAGGGHHKGAHGGQLEACLKASNKVKPGDFTKVEYLHLTDEGVHAYEVEIQGRNGRAWEFECHAKKGTIIEMEQEVKSPDDELFASKAKISESQARKTATDLYPGEIEELEYEIESNGTPSYELDIVDEEGTEFKVEVNAVTGEIIEVQVESWEIGEEDKV